MKYINPIKQLDLLDISSGIIPRAALKSAKKKLLAEFEIQQTTTIQIANQELDKNGVLQLFEQIEEDAVFQHHLTLLEYPLLLDFLETSNPKFFEEHEYVDTKDQAFVDFVAPYFAENYNPLYANALKQKDIQKIRSLNHVLVRKFDQYENELYRNSNRYLHRWIQDLQQITAKRFLHREIAPYIDARTFEIMNRLPSYFETIIDQYADTLHDIALSYFNDRNQHEDAIKLMKRTLQLNVSQGTRDRLQFLNNEMTTILKKANSGYGAKGWLIFILIWILFKIIMTGLSS